VFKDFKEFAFGGNLIDLGVALVMALALTALIGSLVEDIIMPVIGIVFGEASFENLVATVNDSVITYGNFLTALVTFIAVAFGVFFLVVKPYSAYKKRVASGDEEAVPPAEDIELLREIATNTSK